MKLFLENINNLILKECQVALNLKREDLYQIWNLGGLPLSRNAAKAFFVGMDNKNYRNCTDSDILKFFDGLKKYLRDGQRYEEKTEPKNA